MSGKFDGGQGLAWAVASKWLLVALGGAQLVMAAIHLAQLQWPTLVCIAPLPLLTYRTHAELSRRTEELTLLPMVRYAQLDLERKVSSRGRGRGERPHAKDADQKQGPLRTRDHFGGMPPMIRHFIVQLEESAVPAGLAHQDRWGQLVNRV